MRIASQLRKYIQTEIDRGRLHPGDRLPPLRSLAEILGTSYVSVHTAMDKLQKESMVETSKRGTFLSGTNRLKVRLNIAGSDISPQNMRLLLNKHLANTELYLDLDIHAWGEIKSINDSKEIKKNYPAIISILRHGDNREDYPQPSDLSKFSDFKKHLATLNVPDDINFDYALPFYSESNQLGVNRKLMKQIGFDPGKIKNGFGWWPEYLEKCRQSNIMPLACHWERKHLYLLNGFINLLCAICGFSEEKFNGNAPFFNTREGKYFLEILKELAIFEDERPGWTEFFHNRTPLVLGIGPWITTQNNSPEYPDIRVAELDIIPYEMSDGRKCCVYGLNQLEASFREDLVPVERKRIWELMKIMTSRDFQLDFCGKRGALSVVKDVYPAEHYWNRTGEWNAFFPSNDDLIILKDKLFKKEVISALSTIIELYIDGKIGIEETAVLMDQKKEFPKLFP